MENWIVTAVSLVVSIAAVVVSMLNLKVVKRKLFATVITEKRMEWIRSVRELLWKFTDCYSRGGKENKDELKSLKFNIDLYFYAEGNPDQKLLSTTLQRYIEEPGLEIDDLMKISQTVLRNPFNRMKMEICFPRKEERKIWESAYGIKKQI